MTTGPVPGTAGYADAAAAFTERYERLSFDDVHRSVRHHLPPAPGRVLDIGAGTGRDAAALAAMGYDVVAVEPTAAFRDQAAALHPSPRIRWLDDSLPDLRRVIDSGVAFDVVMLTAVWMHLDAAERARAMPIVAGLVRSGGVLVLTLRHGPVPPGRRMFAVSGDETAGLAEAAGLRLTLRLDDQPGATARPDVTWTRLAFARP